MNKGYILISNPLSGHQQQYAVYITLKEAKKVLKDESVIVYVFQIKKNIHKNVLLKYPLCEYYDPLVINTYVDDVITDDEAEYIELIETYDGELEKWITTIKYH